LAEDKDENIIKSLRKICEKQKKIFKKRQRKLSIKGSPAR